MKLVSSIWLVNFAILFNFIFCQASKGQVIPDSSLPNNSEVTSNGQDIQIEGGTTRGANLFHSFEEFSVRADNTASFNNSVNIQNIFSRVTGSSISQINGTLSAQGTANLFLINPNGIIFGENASLNLGGSFLGTTAENIIFEDGFQFDTTADGTTTPLLTITAPLGLGLGTNSGTIINRSAVLDPSGEFPAGLQMQPGNTLALLGGKIVLEGGSLTADEGGRIELGAVADDNTVGLLSDERGWTLNYSQVDSFRDINLSLGSVISSFGDVGGDITIQGQNIALSQGSQISLFTSNSDAGNLIVRGSESVVLDGSDSDIVNEVEGTASGNKGILEIQTKELSILNGAMISTFASSGAQSGVDLRVDASELVEIQGFAISEDESILSRLATLSIGNNPELDSGLDNISGNAGNLIVETRELRITNGAQLSTSTFNQNNAGNLTVVASDSILLQGRDSEGDMASGIFAQVERDGTGNGGSLSIETSELTVLDGAQISTAARNSGQGGDIRIDSNSIFLSGTSPLGNAERSLSAIFTSAQDGASGDSGNIELNTELLTVEKGAALSVNNRGTGQGGNADINIDRLIVRDGGQIAAGSIVDDDAVDNIRGDGGNLAINATDFVEVVGTEVIRGETENSSIFARSEGTGNSGSLSISTPNLTVAEFGNIDVSATGTGEAGSLSIDAQNVTLDGGSLTAETRAGDRGNISLENADTLLLRNSQITTRAFESATGGNITLNSDGIVLLDNSDITANAERGQGGNIQITTQGILQERDIQITAASEFGIDGTITFNTPDVDPVSGIQELPDVPIDAEAVLAQDFCKLENERIAKGSSFIITGRGGLIPTSKDSLTNRDRLVDWASRDDIEVSQSGAVGIRQRQEDSTDNNYPKIQQSQGLLIAADGSKWLTANAPNSTQTTTINHPDCTN